jgi:hypothetical protein
MERFLYQVPVILKVLKMFWPNSAMFGVCVSGALAALVYPKCDFLKVAKSEDEKFIPFVRPEQDVNANKVRIRENCFAAHILEAVNVFYVEKKVRLVLPRWAVDCLDLDWDCMADGVCGKDVESRNVAGKWRSNITHPPKFGDGQMLPDLPCQLVGESFLHGEGGL